MKFTKKLLLTSFALLTVFWSCNNAQNDNNTDETDGQSEVEPNDDATPLVSLINSVSNESTETALTEGGRHLVTLSYGINMVYSDANNGNNQIYWTGSDDFGENWKVRSPHLGSHNDGADLYSAIDANASGSYISYIEQQGQQGAGYVIHLPDPFKNPEVFNVYGPLTPPERACKHSFVSASKAAPNVVYGWTDVERGEIYVGFSENGTEFNEAQLISQDEYALSGPAVSIEENYAALVYQSANPKFYPSEFDGEHDKVFPVWMESVDGGKTWSEPAMLLGHSIKDFPKISATLVDQRSKTTKTNLIAGNGSNIGAKQTSALVWAAADINNPLVFFMNSQTVLDENNKLKPLDNTRNCAGIVSFKPSQLGGDWTHVISNKSMFANLNSGEKKISHSHKYSALPKTKIRAVSYIETNASDQATNDQLVVMISDNGGKSFEIPFTFSAESLGLESGTSLIYDSSPCLRSDKDGNVWMDISYHTTINDKEGLYHAGLPIAMNVKEELLMTPTNEPSPW
ncbi:MAG: hypothetical protein JJ975_10775 [Bacteroidia bacterium]|nr:hypothetical protein [Bacteroidia bacterium]